MPARRSRPAGSLAPIGGGRELRKSAWNPGTASATGEISEHAYFTCGAVEVDLAGC